MNYTPNKYVVLKADGNEIISNTCDIVFVDPTESDEYAEKTFEDQADYDEWEYEWLMDYVVEADALSNSRSIILSVSAYQSIVNQLQK